MAQDPVARFLAEPAPVAVADDPVSRFLSGGRTTTAGEEFKRNYLGTTSGKLLGLAELPLKLADDAMEFFGVDEDDRKVAVAVVKALTPHREFMAAEGRRQRTMQETVPGGTPTFGGRVAGAAASMIPMLPEAILGGVVGGPTGAKLAMAGQTAAIAGERMHETAEQGGVGPGKRIAATLVGGAAEAGVEMIGMERFFGPLAAVLRGAPSTVKQRLAVTLLKDAGAAALEGVEEPIQAGLADAVENWLATDPAASKSFQEWATTVDEKLVQSAIEEGIPAATVAALFGGAVRAVERGRKDDRVLERFDVEQGPETTVATPPEGVGAAPGLENPPPLVGDAQPPQVQAAMTGLPLAPGATPTSGPAGQLASGTAQEAPGSTLAPEASAVAPPVSDAAVDTAAGGSVATAPAAAASGGQEAGQADPVARFLATPAARADAQQPDARAPLAAPPAGVTPTEGVENRAQQAGTEQGAAPSLPAEKEEPPAPADRTPEAFDRAPTSVKNRIVDAELEAIGLPPATHAERLSFERANEMAEAKLAEDPDAGRKLLSELRENERATSGEEVALLTRERNRLRLARQSVEDTIVAAHESGTEDAIPELQRQAAAIQDEFSAASDIVTRVGTKTAQGLALRRMEMREDYSLAAMERATRAAKGGAPLSTEESEQVRDLHRKLDEANRRFDEYVAEQQRKEVERAAEVSAGQLKLEVRQRRKAQSKKKLDSLYHDLHVLTSSQANVGLDPKVLKLVVEIVVEHVKLGINEFAAVAEQVVSRAGEAIRPYLQSAWDEAQASRKAEVDALVEKIRASLTQDSALRLQVRRLSEIYAAEGVTDRDSLIDAVHKKLTEVDPKMSRRRAMDLISGYGDFRPLPQGDVRKRLRELRGEMQQLAKLEDLQRGTPPLKTGPERRTPTAEERRLIKQVNEAKKRLGIRTTDPARQVQSALDSIQTRLQHQIADLQHQIDTKQAAVPDNSPSPTSPEIEALRKQRDALREEYDRIFHAPEQRPGHKEVMRAQAAEKALEKAIADYEKRIKAGDIAAKETPDGLSTPRLAALRARREALSEELEALRAAANPKKSPEEISLQAFKTRTKNEIARLREQIAAENFAPKQRKQLALDEQAIKLKAEAEAVKREFMRGLARQRWKNRTRGEKVRGLAKEFVVDLPRALVTAWDLSAPGRQGIWTAASHPILAARAMRQMFRALESDQAALEIDTALRSRPLAQFALASKLELTELEAGLGKQEEAIRSRFAERFPGVKMSNRAFITFLNSLRMQAFEAMVKTHPDKMTPERGKAIASYVNIGTGRGDPGKLAGAMEAASLFLWAPKLLLSRFQLLSGHSIRKAPDAETRKLFVKEYARSLTGFAAMFAIAALAGAEFEWDPREADFGKFRFGNTRVDPLGGLAQVTRFVARMGQHGWNFATGSDADVPGGSAANAIGTLLRTKVTPTLGAFIDALDKKTVTGGEVTPGSLAAQLTIPMSFRTIHETMQEHGVPGTIALSVLSILGFGVQTYDEGKR